MSVSAHVQKNSLNKDGFTEYFILILYKGSEWGIRKRYSDFVKFDTYLQDSGYDICYKLPEKNFWSRLDPSLISKRMVELQNYMSSLLQNTLSTDNNLIREFLEVDENILSMAIKQSRRRPHQETSYAKRLDVIVKNTRKTMISIGPLFRGNTNRHNTMLRNRSNLTPPASPLQSRNRVNSLVASCRSMSSERRLNSNVMSLTTQQSPPSSRQSPQITPHGSFSQLSQHHRGSSFGPASESNKNLSINSSYLFGGRESRDGRASSVNQANNRFLLGSYSGQTALDVGLAVEDVHRREAFSAHVFKIWNKHMKDVSETGSKENTTRKTNGRLDPTSASKSYQNVSKVINHILQTDVLSECVPHTHTQDHESMYRHQFCSRGGTETESDAEGAMFRDDSNSFILDCLSEPVLTILNSKGLAMHEELDVQAECFEKFSIKRREKVLANFGAILVHAKWMNDSDN